MSDAADLRSRAWGRSMLLEFAAKQQVVPIQHMFTDTITPLDSDQLAALIAAVDALDTGQADGKAFRRLLQSEGDLQTAVALLRAAVGPLSAAPAGLALAFAYMPFEVADAFAVNVVVGASLKRVARALDPRASLPTRTRLFLANNLIKDATLRGLVACTASVVILRANALADDAGSLIARSARGRLRRAAQAAAALLANPAIMAEALRCCLAGDWWNADGLMRHIAREAGIRCGDDFQNPPALADLLLISTMPTCDTIDAIERLLQAEQRVIASAVV